MAIAETEPYTEAAGADAAADRADRHRRQALEALDAGDPQAALTHAVLALAARVDEMSYFIARLG